MGVFKQLLKRYFWNIRGFLVVFLMLVFVMMNLILNQMDQSEINFLKRLNLQVTFVIKKVNHTGNHGYGVVYGEVLKTNQPAPYTACYQNQYTICKIQGKRILLVTYNSMMQEGDTVVLNTHTPEYTLRRHGRPAEITRYTITTDFFLYAEIAKNRYMDFSSY